MYDRYPQVKMRLEKRGVVQLVVDLVFLLVLGIPFLVVHLVVPPFQRGFFCNDQSIQYPYKTDTVSMGVCAASFLVAGVLSFVIIEVVFGHLRKMTIAITLWNTAKCVLAFVIGAGITVLLAEVGKLSVGRLRPHFISVCRPDVSQFNCSIGYITDFTCQNLGDYSEKTMSESRKSFPSGHAAFSAFCALFLGIYYQLRLKGIGWSVLLKVVLQVAVAVWAFYVMCSRVSDYKHHWSDVLAGCVLGLFVAVWTVLALGRHLSFFGLPWWDRELSSSTEVGLDDSCGAHARSPINSTSRASCSTTTEII